MSMAISKSTNTSKPLSVARTLSWLSGGFLPKALQTIINLDWLGNRRWKPALGLLSSLLMAINIGAQQLVCDCNTNPPSNFDAPNAFFSDFGWPVVGLFVGPGGYWLGPGGYWQESCNGSSQNPWQVNGSVGFYNDYGYAYAQAKCSVLFPNSNQFVFAASGECNDGAIAEQFGENGLAATPWVCRLLSI